MDDTLIVWFTEESVYYFNKQVHLFYLAYDKTSTILKEPLFRGQPTVLIS